MTPFPSSVHSAGKPEALDFLELLNSLHPSLSFTMEAEENGKLPFLDALVMRDVDKFSTTIYRKPTATGLYTRWDSYSDTSKKFALIRTLALRAKRICSPEHLAAALVKVRAILQRNGCPRPIVDQVVDSVVNKLPVETVKRKPIYLRLPWIGSASVAFRKRIQCLTRKAVPFSDAITSFTSRALIHPCRKDVLPTEDLSNVIYLFTCGCGRRYVGRTSQRLGDRVKQHLPRKLINSEQKGAELDKEQQPVSARTRSHGTPEEVLDGPVSSRTRSHNAGAAILAVTGGTPDGKDTPGDDDMRTQSLDGPVASRTRSHDPKPDAAPQLMAVDTPAEEDDTIDCDDSSRSSDDDS